MCIRDRGGATQYDGSSICSIGYSLFLVPVCALLKSPYAAYKAVILLNGIFLCGSYIMAVLTAKKLFSNERESFLSAACFFAVFCPAFAASWIYTGPEMQVQFFFWCAIYFLNELWMEEMCIRDRLSSDDYTYETYSGRAAGMDGRVKFIIETAPIETEDE